MKQISRRRRKEVLPKRKNRGTVLRLLYISLLPIVVALFLIAFGAIAEAAGLKSPVVTFFGDPVFALFVGLLGAYLLAWRTLPNGRVGEAMNEGFDATGQGALWAR
jgi:GntP family gluconate:H+ symporter